MLVFAEGLVGRVSVAEGGVGVRMRGEVGAVDGFVEGLDC